MFDIQDIFFVFVVVVRHAPVSVRTSSIGAQAKGHVLYLERDVHVNRMLIYN
jgi:hypothetical protein